MITRTACLLWISVGSLAAAATAVRIEGMRGKANFQVLEMMGGRLAHVRDSPPAPPLAEDAAFLLRQLLRKEGYADAEVSWSIPDARTVLLTVNEGRRFQLGQVTIRGVPDHEAKRLARIYAGPAEKDRPMLIGPPPFREKDLEKGLGHICQELNAQGYWSAQARLATRADNPKTGIVDLTIDVSNGPLFPIAPPLVRSTDGRGVKLVTRATQPFAGRPATTANLNAMRLAAEEIAVSRGYPEAVIRMSRSPAPTAFVPVFDIDLGTRVRLRDVLLAGLERTQSHRILQRTRGLPGEWYDAAAVNRLVRDLLATGAFSSARAETTPADGNLVDLTLHFQEAKAKEITLAAGYGTYQGAIGRFGYADRNFHGGLRGLSAGFELSSRGLLGDVRLTDPWIYGSDIAAMLRGYALIYSRDGYDSYNSGIEGSLTWTFGDHYQLEALAGSSVVKTSGDGLPSSALGETLYTRPRLRMTQSLEFRDNPILPQKGWHLECPVELGAALGGTSTSYLAAGLEAGWTHRLSRSSQIGLGGQWAAIAPDRDGANLPIDLRLFNGGARTVRSFPERELGPSVNGYPLGGEAMWNTNLELIRTLGGPLKGVAFFDAGSLADDREDLIDAEVELATGLGLRLDLPIGPVRLEYGYNLTRDRGEPNGTFHFAIGHAF